MNDRPIDEEKTVDNVDNARESFVVRLLELIETLQYIPIVSKAIYYDRLFDRDKLIEFVKQRKSANEADKFAAEGQTRSKQPGNSFARQISANALWQNADPLGCSIEDILAEVWAGEIGFPLPESHMLSRVALYHQFKHRYVDYESNKSYLQWLKKIFLDYAEFDLLNSEIEEGLRKSRSTKIPALKEDLKNRRDYSLSYIAQELDFLPTPEPRTNPLAVLARLNLPLYITTSPFDFLEKEIAVDRPNVQTQICFRSNRPENLAKAHKTKEDLDPKEDKPVVYHLFGMEDYPQTMVLNEDQYLTFLQEFFHDSRRDNQYIPSYVSQKIPRYSLLLLGYRLRDLEFRIMLKGLIGPVHRIGNKFDLAIQLNPESQCPRADADSVKAYLKGYLENHQFTVHWDTTEVFMAKLFKEWQQWNKLKGY